MYSPIMWANPNNLKHIKEEKKIEHTFDNQMEAVEKKQINSKENFFERLYKSLALGRLFKISNSSYSYK